MGNGLFKIGRLAFLICVWQSRLLAQNNQVAFGRITEITVGARVTGIVTGDFNDDKRTDLCVYGPSTISLIQNSGPDSFSAPRSFHLTGEIDRIVPADCNRDGLTDIVCFSSVRKALSSYLNKRDRFTLVWSDDVPFPADNLLLRDVNGDRAVDIVVFGKKVLGVYPWLGRGDGTFRSQQALLEEYSFSRLLLTDLNGDRVLDALGFDWVNNQLLVFFGIGHLKFSAPSSISITSELADIAAWDIDSDNNIDILALYRDTKEFHAFLGDGLGHFADGVVLPLSTVPSKIIIQDVNRDGREDALIFSESDKNISVYFNSPDKESIFRQHVDYSAGSRPADVASFRSTGGRVNLAVLEKQNRSVLVYHDVEYSPIRAEEQVYGLGLSPSRITTYDFNRDGKPDLLVSNSQSEQLSLFINRGDGTFFGQIPIGAERYAEAIDVVAKSESTSVCALTHQRTEKVSLTEITYPSLNVQRSSFSTGLSPRILRINQEKKNNANVLLLSTRSEPSGSMTISEVHEMQYNKFFEQSYFELPDRFIWAVDVCDLNGDSRVDAVHLSSEMNARKLYLGVSLGLPEGKFATSYAIALPDTALRGADIWCADLNADGRTDIILQMHAQGDDYVRVGYGITDSSFEFAPGRLQQVALKGRGSIALTDIDNDGLKDLVVFNSLTKTIQDFLSKGGSGFSNPYRVMSVPSGGGFVVSDFNGDHIPDYAVVNSEPGILRVILGKE